MSAGKHGCVERLNEQLAAYNTSIAQAISFSEPGRELIQVATVKKDSDKRGKPMALFASFCPFCGKPLRRGVVSAKGTGEPS